MLSSSKLIRYLLVGIFTAAGVLSIHQYLSGSQADAKTKAGTTAETLTAENYDPIVEVDTSKGPIKIKIFKKEAPLTAGNFLDLVNRHFYDGLTFHRYVKGFVIQGGDPRGDGSGNFTDPKTGKDRLIQLERNPELKHDCAGMVAMARTSDPDSASCQWYITLAPAPFLDDPPGYAVFGKVVAGLDNVLQLRAGDRMTKVYLTK